MAGEKQLNRLLDSLSPDLMPQEYVFSTCSGNYGDFAELSPLGAFAEKEGLTLILKREDADKGGLSYEGVFRCITLRVHSSLEAVGLTAAVSEALANRSISANMIAAYFHDHIFVPAHKAEEALAVLQSLGAPQRS